ncbi:phosphohistidine phosphatase SixA [Affinibrenneria salicis]|uniref:Phosphohistidine phosphatase SixA n=1 Tax=Affinibrenneria salicis TaxID=2590031 RepID=A0A5J5FTP1_9GAMM|nr:phosphohistidine phosphatase SixA [Affinibrenneria salicis]KAA8996955.1 phosphohistidine phosphatase SixA [Affinibrenneria salicis]
MQVLIMRHGDALPEAASDAVRPLSERGRDESRQMAQWLEGQGLDIERALVSPYVRAQQTLQTVRDVLTVRGAEEVLSQLTPGGDARYVASYLQALAQEKSGTVLVVSHLPLVGYLVAELCPAESAPMFATSAIACVTLDDDGRGVCDWMIGPAQLVQKADVSGRG